MADSVTRKQRQLMRQLISELRDCNAFGVDALDKKMSEAVTKLEASELIGKAINMLREYNHSGTIC